MKTERSRCNWYSSLFFCSQFVIHWLNWREKTLLNQYLLWISVNYKYFSTWNQRREMIGPRVLDREKITSNNVNAPNYISLELWTLTISRSFSDIRKIYRISQFFFTEIQKQIKFKFRWKTNSNGIQFWPMIVIRVKASYKQVFGEKIFRKK